MKKSIPLRWFHFTILKRRIGKWQYYSEPIENRFYRIWPKVVTKRKNVTMRKKFKACELMRYARSSKYLYRYVGVPSIFGYSTEYMIMHGRRLVTTKGRSVTVW